MLRIYNGDGFRSCKALGWVLRNLVIHRKVTGGFCSETGAQAHAVVSSIVDTARNCGQDILQVIQELVGTPAPTPPVYTLAG